MKNIEITTRIKDSLEKTLRILQNQGFKIKEKYLMKDIYLSERVKELKKTNILDILSSCVLLREIIEEDNNIRYLVYKDKVYDSSRVISEDRIKVIVDNLDNVSKIFNKLGFSKLVQLQQDMTIVSNGKIELCLQDVSGLGLMLEYENNKDFTNVSCEDILKEKRKMLEEIKSYNLNITDEYDVKKAYELIYKDIDKNKNKD